MNTICRVLFTLLVASLPGVLNGHEHLATQADLPQVSPDQADTSSLVPPRLVCRVVADGQHNAFTALASWKDRFFLAFRRGMSHGSFDGDIVIMQSADGQRWSEGPPLDIFGDDRDPQLLSVDQRLFLYCQCRKEQRRKSFVTFTEDGKTWSSPQPVYEPGFVVWKPVSCGKAFFAAAHRPGPIVDRQCHLIKSTNGLCWHKVSVIRAGRGESESAVHYGSGDPMTVFVRNQTHLAGSILESRPPYTVWNERSSSVHLSGHCVQTLRGVTYLFSRALDGTARRATSLGGSSAGTMIYTYEKGQLHPYCFLGGRFDCSYADVEEVGNEMLVSFYSAHEYDDWTENDGPADIFLARVPLKDTAN